MGQPFVIALLLLGVAVRNCDGASLGLPKIFEKFLNVSDFVGQLPPVFQNIAEDFMDDVRHLIPEVEKILDEKGYTEIFLTELGKILNVTHILNEVIPELDKFFVSNNVTEEFRKIKREINISKINDELIPELEKLFRENNITETIAEYKKFLNVSLIADILLDELDKFLESNNITEAVAEIKKFISGNDITNQLFPDIKKLLESNNITQALAVIKRLLQINDIVGNMIPEFIDLLESNNITEALTLALKFLNISDISDQMIPELAKLLESDGAAEALTLVLKFLNISDIGEQMVPALEKILESNNITEALTFALKFLNTSDLTIKMIPELEKLLESNNVTKVLALILEFLKINDIRSRMIPQLEILMEGNNITEALALIVRFLNISDISHELGPELEKLLENSNITASLTLLVKVLNVSDIHHQWIPELERLLENNNITEALGMIVKFLNVSNIAHKLIPELEKIMEDHNITETLAMIIRFLNISDIGDISGKLIPGLLKIFKSNDISEALTFIIKFLKVNDFSGNVIPALETLLGSDDLTKALTEIMKHLDVSDISDKLIPGLEEIFKSTSIAEFLAAIKKLLDISLVDELLLPELEKLIASNDITSIFPEIKKIFNVTKIGGELLDELQKLLDESNITYHVPELKPFLNLSIIREKLPELQRLLDHSNFIKIVIEIEKFFNVSYLKHNIHLLANIFEDTAIPDILSEVERILSTNYVKKLMFWLEKFIERTGIPEAIYKMVKLLNLQLPTMQIISDVEKMLENIGVKKILSDVDKLLNFSLIENAVSKIELIDQIFESSNLTEMITHAEKLLDTNYIRAKIVPVIEELVESSNLFAIINGLENFLDTSYMRAAIVPEIERIWENNNFTEMISQIEIFLNASYIRHVIEVVDNLLNITLIGEKISNGGFADVVCDILELVFTTPTMEQTTASPPTAAPSSFSSTSPQTTEDVIVITEKPTLPPVCITDCQGVACGNAIINSCGECVLGTTGRDVNHGKDCNNVCNGTARNDSCHACTNPPKNDRTGRDSPFADCYGTCFGSADIDSCGDCSGGDTGKIVNYRQDACGLCDGDNSICAGCDGVPNSGKVNDSCGVCGGDGSSCTTISMVVPSLLPTASTSPRTVLVRGAGLDGSAIKCIFDGRESVGTKVNRTHCQCTLPDNIQAGTYVFTVKVVKNGADIPTANLSIILYDAVSTKIVTMLPTEIFTAETITVIFGGSGWTESSGAVCMVNGTKIKAVFQGGNYNCTLAAFTKSTVISLALSLNGVHELASDANLNRLVYTRGPTLTTAQFSDTGALINAEFNKDVDMSSLASCGDIFDSTSVQHLGTSPDCTWSDGRHLIITPGANAQILPSHRLTLKQNALKSGGELYSKYASGSVNLDAPANAVRPVPVIIGPTQISSCGHLSLDGSQSSGGGGRNLKYTWSLVGITHAGISAALAQAEDKAKAFINGTLMTSGSTYRISLTVENFLSSSTEESFIEVTKAIDPLPEVTMDGPLGGRVLAATSSYITAMAQAASCSFNKALTFSWSVRCTNDDSTNAAKTRVESSPGYKRTSSKSALKIDSGALVGGKTYEFQVVVALKASPSIATTMKTTVVVEWSPLEPTIVGGDRTLGRDSGSIVLDAKSSTVDPDNAPGDMSCSWICTDKSNGQPCYSAVHKQNKIALPGHCVIIIDSREFEAGKFYKIQSQVSKGSRTGSSSISLTVVTGNPPAVSVLRSSIKVTASEKVRLQGMYNSSIRPTKVEWICAQHQDHRYIDISDSSLSIRTSDTYNPNGESFSVKVLQPNVLTPGATYTFILKVDDGSKVGSSNMVVHVRNGPTSGTFEANPLTLQQLQTVTLTAARWATDSDAYPLQYEFGFVHSSGIFQPWITQTSNEYTIPVPPGYGAHNKLTLRMNVKDAFGSMKSMEQNVTVNPAISVDEEKMKSIIDSNLQTAGDTGDYSKAIPNLRNILQTVSRNANVSANLAKVVTHSTVNALLLAVDSTSLDEEKAEPILKTFLEVGVGYVEKPKEVLGGFKEVVRATKQNLEKETIDETLKWVADVSAKADLRDKDVLKDLTSVDESLASGLASNLELGQPPIETSADNPRAVIKVEHSVLQGSVQTRTSSDAAEVEFGNEMSGKYDMWNCAPGKVCLGVKLKFINYKEDYYSSISTNKPSILSDKIVSISLQNPETGDDLVVNGLNEPIKLTFKTGTPSEGKMFVAYYYDEYRLKWSSDGMTWSLVYDQLKVLVSHLTSFTPAEEVDTSTEAPALLSDKSYRISFVLSNTSWKESYLNSNDPNRIALSSEILREMSRIYKDDPTTKNLQFVNFEKSGDFVKVVLQMTFEATNTDPSQSFKQSVADGKLGDLVVDVDSVDWVEYYAKSIRA